MKQLFYSEKLDKMFDTEAACAEAEKAAELAEAERKAKEDEAKKVASTEKKELDEKIRAAKLATEQAYKNLDSVKEECAKILTESNKQVEDLLATARKEISKCKADETDLIVEFAEKFGPYSIKLTGQSAKDAFNRSMKNFNDEIKAFDRLFKFFW